MWGCMIYLSLVSVLSPSDERQVAPCVKKQRLAPTEKQSIVLRNGTNRKTHFRQLKEGRPKKKKALSVRCILKVFGASHCRQTAA